MDLNKENADLRSQIAKLVSDHATELGHMRRSLDLLTAQLGQLLGGGMGMLQSTTPVATMSTPGSNAKISNVGGGGNVLRRVETLNGDASASTNPVCQESGAVRASRSGVRN